MPGGPGGDGPCGCRAVSQDPVKQAQVGRTPLPFPCALRWEAPKPRERVVL